MPAFVHRVAVSTLMLATVASAVAQRALQRGGALLVPQGVAEISSRPAVEDRSQELLNFKDADIKFSLRDLMELLRDHQHEGWVLAAYPDPNTGHPLIGAGFSLDVPAVDHPQVDRFNPHSFIEPSSAQLWQAAGLSPVRLQQILDQFDRNQKAWSAKTYRRKIVRRRLTPQLTNEEAMRLLRISAIQAVYNARAYCRGFDRLSGPQQMALTQLVFQMGTNLEQFVQFLDTLNDEDNRRELARLDGYMLTDEGHWKLVQETLMDSQWARRYSVRAATVIAMFDPEYLQAPGLAEGRVMAVIHPPVWLAPKERSTVTLRRVNYSKRTSKARGRKTRVPVKRKLT